MGDSMKDRALRAIELCKRIAGMTEEDGRITRRYLSPPFRDVHRLLSERMHMLGMVVRVDAAGNLRGVWTPVHAGKKRLVMGSHIDTVPDAGAFDGVLGVAIALEWVELAQELGLHVPFELIAFSEEEGVRFQTPFLGSRAVAGLFDPALLELRDREGISLRETIQAFGLDPAGIEQAPIVDDALGFVEVHIEQGPVLEAEQLSLAAVTSIVGQTRGTFTFAGQANHAGATPMHLRHDALAAAAEWISLVEQIALRTRDLVATVGEIHATPNAGNVIAGAVDVSLDCRHAHDAVRIAAVEELLRAASEIALRRGISVRWNERMNQSAVAMDERLTTKMIEAMRDAGLPPRRMTSGAGHDAMIMASRMPSVMLFVRSPGGISHHPSETVFVEDVEASLQVGSRFLQRIAADFS